MIDNKQGGHSTATLNHLVSPSPLKELVDTVLEEEQLLLRLHKISVERARHELTLRIAGVPREVIQKALESATKAA